MGWRLVLRVPRSTLAGAALVTGFRGFGMVGYMASKYLALGLGAKKIGYFYAPEMEQVLSVEEDGIGFPHELYYSDAGGGVVVVVNRVIAASDASSVDAFKALVDEMASLAADFKLREAILIGGLSREFMGDNERFRYRWLRNSYYRGPGLKAPEMEKGLGVVGPLALLFMALDARGVPAIMVLPYSHVEEVDYRAAKLAIDVISDYLGVEVNLESLVKAMEEHRFVAEQVRRMIQAAMESERSERGGIYM